MTYQPRHNVMDPLQAERGVAHALWDWKRDLKLRQRWPAKWKSLEAKCSHQFLIGCYHWKGLGQGRGGVDLRVTGWADPCVMFNVNDRLDKPLALIRVHLRWRQSQYLGWIDGDRFLNILPQRVRVSWKHDVRVERRIVRASDLQPGFPPAQQGRLF